MRIYSAVAIMLLTLTKNLTAPANTVQKSYTLLYLLKRGSCHYGSQIKLKKRWSMLLHSPVLSLAISYPVRWNLPETDMSR